MVCQPSTQEPAAIVTHWQTNIFRSRRSSLLRLRRLEHVTRWLPRNAAPTSGSTFSTRSCQNGTKGQSSHFITFSAAEEQQISHLTPTLLASGGKVLALP